MCGILGSINLPLVEESLNTIFHRGPDSGVIEKFDIRGSTVYFGHRRLAIVDLTATGHQPMLTQDAKFALIVNGEIYNHLELREKLKGIHFRGSSDTETILYYLAQYGIQAVADFNGGI